MSASWTLDLVCNKYNQFQFLLSVQQTELPRFQALVSNVGGVELKTTAFEVLKGSRALIFILCTNQ